MTYYQSLWNMTETQSSIAKRPDPSFDTALSEYLAKFEYRVILKLGHTYTVAYNDFHAWCKERLGEQYKDWFIYPLGNGKYQLFMRNAKWASFLALTWVDNLE